MTDTLLLDKQLIDWERGEERYARFYFRDSRFATSMFFGMNLSSVEGELTDQVLSDLFYENVEQFILQKLKQEKGMYARPQ